MTEREVRADGALQTKLTMDAVRRLRIARKWSAQQLAAEMTKVGVPWNADVVVNLEHGRRKSLRVHELLALAWVLDVDNPLDLLVPDDPRDRVYPVTPDTLLDRNAIRAWFMGETGPLREWLSRPREGEPEDLAARLREMPESVREQVIMLARSTVRAPRASDGED